MRFRFDPFGKDQDLEAIENDDLVKLKDVSEGWYVEYKSQPIPVKAIAKGLSSFANQYGGWLIFGVEEDKNKKTAKEFPGINNVGIPELCDAIRNASKDAVSPDIYYQTKTIEGPIENINLSPDHSILIVRIPPGPETPYIHADARVYRRVADSSHPVPETDRSTLDMLWARGERAKKKLANFVSRVPSISQDQKNQCFLHLSILSDPYEIGGHRFNGTLEEFAEIMGDKWLPFDNIYTKTGGFVARQVANNEPTQRIFTWEFDRKGHSFVTLPINQLRLEPDSLFLYNYGNDFASLVSNYTDKIRILDLNILYSFLHSVLEKHRTLANQSNIKGPFYVKAHLENTWRTVPFLDLSFFIEHTKKYGVPVVQDDNVLAPPGTDLDEFIQLKQREPFPLGIDFSRTGENERSRAVESALDAIQFAASIFNGLGVSSHIFDDNEVVIEILKLSENFQKAQDIRSRDRLGDQES